MPPYPCDQIFQVQNKRKKEYGKQLLLTKDNKIDSFTNSSGSHGEHLQQQNVKKRYISVQQHVGGGIKKSEKSVFLNQTSLGPHTPGLVFFLAKKIDPHFFVGKPIYNS